MTSIIVKLDVEHLTDLESDLIKKSAIFENFLKFARSAEKTYFDHNKTLHRDDNVFSKLPTCFTDNYLPVKTRADGNCLWNIVSICLFNNEAMSDVLRFISTYIIIKDKTLYKELIRTTIMASNDYLYFQNINDHNPSQNFEDYINNITNEKLNQIILSARNLADWGNVYHLLSLAIAFEINIFVYGSFPKQFLNYEFDELININK